MGTAASGALVVWVAAAESKVPLWPAYVFGALAVAGLVVTVMSLAGWGPWRTKPELEQALPVPDVPGWEMEATEGRSPRGERPGVVLNARRVDPNAPKEHVRFVVIGPTPGVRWESVDPRPAPLAARARCFPDHFDGADHPLTEGGYEARAVGHEDDALLAVTRFVVDRGGRVQAPDVPEAWELVYDETGRALGPSTRVPHLRDVQADEDGTTYLD